MLLLQQISLLRIVDRQQAGIIAGFNSTTRVNTRLLKLRHAGLLKRFFFVSPSGGKRAVYCLSKKGGDLAGTPANAISRPQDSFLLGDKFVAHQLAINDVYCSATISKDQGSGADTKWHPPANSLRSLSHVVPDAYFEIRFHEVTRPMFLEVDLGTEGLPVWRKKLTEYLSLASSGEFEKIFRHPRFGVAVVASSEKRMLLLQKEISKATQKLFYFTTLEQIKAKSFWSQIWFRPVGDQRQSLI